ncbi:MAG: class I SAM-dependent methyltransferase [Dehalococcoidia bacterium]|nr:class I SAM-dependent methyltransferase [Dehalococcoidia bacterium]
MADSSDRVHPVDYSEEFYRHHARRYAEVAHRLIQSIYIRSSHPALKGDYDLLERLKELTPGPRGLDAGCGSGARDVYQFWLEGYDIIGIDAVEENILTAKSLHPEIADRVFLADLRVPVDFPDESFDFIVCDAVIQHQRHVAGTGTTAEMRWRAPADVQKRTRGDNSV